MAPVSRNAFLYIDARGTRTIKQTIDMDPEFYAPWRDPETIDSYRFKIEQILKNNMERYPFLRDSPAQVYVACKNLEGEQWAELKRFVEPHILYHYPYTLHPLRFEDRGIIDLPYFISLMRYEKAKYMYKERRDWYEGEGNYPNHPTRHNVPVFEGSRSNVRNPANPKPEEQEGSQGDDWSRANQYLQMMMDEGRKRRGGEMEVSSEAKRTRVETGNQEDVPAPLNPEPSNPEDDEGNEEVEPHREEEEGEEDPEMPELELAPGEEEEEFGEDENEEEEEDPEEEDENPEEEEELGENSNYSSIDYSVESSSSSSPAPPREFPRMKAPEYATDSQNDLDDDDEKYLPAYQSD